MVTEEELAATVDKYERICEDAYKKAGEETQTFHKHWLDSPWSGFFEGKDPLKVSKKTILHSVFHRLTTTGCGHGGSRGDPDPHRQEVQPGSAQRAGLQDPPRHGEDPQGER